MDDPAVADNTTMTDGERRLSVQLFCVLALTCRKVVSGGEAGARRVWIRGLETVVQRVRAPSFFTISRHAASDIVANKLVALDYGFLGRDRDGALATILVLVQRPHGAVGLVKCFVKDASPMQWTACRLTSTHEVWPAKRRDTTMVEKSPKYSHQSNGAVENAVRRTGSLTRTHMRVLQKKLGCKIDSKSIVLPWLVRHAAYVLSRFIKRDDGRSAWAQLRGKECDSPMAPIGETVDFKVVRGDVAKLEPRWAVGIFLGSTDESDEAIVGTAAGIDFARSLRRRTKDKQWERDAFTTFWTTFPWTAPPTTTNTTTTTTVGSSLSRRAFRQGARQLFVCVVAMVPLCDLQLTSPPVPSLVKSSPVVGMPSSLAVDIEESENDLPRHEHVFVGSAHISGFLHYSVGGLLRSLCWLSFGGFAVSAVPTCCALPIYSDDLFFTGFVSHVAVGSSRCLSRRRLGVAL